MKEDFGFGVVSNALSGGLKGVVIQMDPDDDERIARVGEGTGYGEDDPTWVEMNLGKVVAGLIAFGVGLWLVGLCIGG